MKAAVISEAITFHHHSSADDSIALQAISTCQMVLALSHSGALVYLCGYQQSLSGVNMEASKPATFLHPEQIFCSLSSELWCISI